MITKDLAIITYLLLLCLDSRCPRSSCRQSEEEEEEEEEESTKVPKNIIPQKRIDTRNLIY